MWLENFCSEKKILAAPSVGKGMEKKKRARQVTVDQILMVGEFRRFFPTQVAVGLLVLVSNGRVGDGDADGDAIFAEKRHPS